MPTFVGGGEGTPWREPSMTGKHARARGLRLNSTDAERRMWTLLRDRRLEVPKFRRQVSIGPYVVDFYCSLKNLIIELDGGQHSAQVVADEVRTAWLNAKGYRVVRYWNNEVLRNPEGVLTDILRLVKPDDGNSVPSPLEGEGQGEGSMTLSFHIREATEADLPQIAAIHHRNWQIAYAGIMTAEEIDVIHPEKRLPQWRQWMADPSNMILVATAPDTAVQGFVYGGKVKPHEILSGDLDGFDCEIYSLHTAEAVQGKGLGRALIADAARRWRGMGRRALMLWAYRDNPFRGFYERIGGAVVAEGLDDGIPDVAYGWRDLGGLLNACMAVRS